MSRRILLICGSLQARSANRAALDVARSALESTGADVEEFTDLEMVPAFNPDAGDEGRSMGNLRRRRDDAPTHSEAVVRLREQIAGSDAVMIAAPEYAGALAGAVKNALDWIVGSGELYSKPAAVISAGTSGGEFARQQLIQTLTWQGAHVVADVGIVAPRTKSDADGRYTDEATLAAIRDLAAVLIAAPGMAAGDRLTLVRTVLSAAGVGLDHIAPVA